VTKNALYLELYHTYIYIHAKNVKNIRESKLLDDPVDAWIIHGVCAFFGSIFTAAFVDDELFFEVYNFAKPADLFTRQLTGSIFIGLFVFIINITFFYITILFSATCQSKSQERRVFADDFYPTTILEDLFDERAALRIKPRVEDIKGIKDTFYFKIY